MKRLHGILLALTFCFPILAPSAQSPAQSNVATVRSITASVQADQGNPDVRVWVNTASGVYHCPGTRWYGNTKHGEYMTQTEAQKKGYRPAYGKVCR